MTDISFRSDVTATLVQHVGSDAAIVQAAKVSNGQEIGDQASQTGLINYLMKHRHGTPFEHNSLTFLVEAPIFVMREMMRHRIGFSYNETSARYRDLEPVFYVPPPQRGLVRTTSAARPVMEVGSPEQQTSVEKLHMAIYEHAWVAYTLMREAGVASEVARNVLPVGIFSSAYVTCNARSLMAFLSLRTHVDDAAFVSYPLAEIEWVANQMEFELETHFPLTHDAFHGNGRVAP